MSNKESNNQASNSIADELHELLKGFGTQKTKYKTKLLSKIN